MYSGTTIRTKSGRIAGAHQRIDRLARRGIKPLLNDSDFPVIKEILHFEGKNGPDGLKRKSPGADEPWHFIDPDHDGDTHELYVAINDHIVNLHTALQKNDTVRASFEAAWLAHVVTDGLTPAHHHPYEEKLAELRNGEHHSTRATRLQKAMMPGATMRELVRNNWYFWGTKGLMTTHLGFELGVAAAITPLRSTVGCIPSDEELARARNGEYIQLFRASLRRVDDLEMYETYERYGWTHTLARQARTKLTPEIVKAVILAWYAALHGAGQ